MSKQTENRKLDAWVRLRAAAKDPASRISERDAAISEARAAGWSYASIGSALGITAQAVHAHVQRNAGKGNK